MSSSYQIHGNISEGFEQVRNQFEKYFIDGLERNAQICVYVGEEKVVDLWGSANNDTDYNANSITNVFSSTKSLAAICIATLVNKKLLDYSDKIIKHWPEYGNGDEGKEKLTIADILRHEGGMPQFTQTLRLADLLTENIKKNSIGRIIEKEPLRFPPGGKSTREYHGLTRGCILNEIFRRVDPEGRTIGECLRADVCSPLEADCYIGLPFELLSKSYKMSASSIGQVVRTSMVPKFLGRKSEIGLLDILKLLGMVGGMKDKKPPVENMTGYDIVAQFENSIVQSGELPSANGQCSARGLARVAAMMANKGTLDGVEILSDETWNSFHSDYEESKIMHPFMGESHFTQGGVSFFTQDQNVKSDYLKSALENRAGYFGWMGLGGSAFQWFPEHKIGFAYVPTHLSWEDLINGKAALLQRIVLDVVKGTKV